MYETAIGLLDGTRVRSPASFTYIVLMKRPVDPVSKTPMAVRASYLMHSRCRLSCVLHICIMETGSLNFTLRPVVWSIGILWPVGGAARTQWFAWIDVEILLVLSSCANNALI